MTSDKKSIAYSKNSLLRTVEPSHDAEMNDTQENTNANSLNIQGAKLKLDELFARWLCLDNTREMITTFIKDAKEGRSININPPQPLPRSPTFKKIDKIPTLKSIEHLELPPLDDEESDDEVKAKHDEHDMSTNTNISESPPSKNDSCFDKNPTNEQIPKFYFPKKSNQRHRMKETRDFLIAQKRAVDSIFENFPDGMVVDDFVSITKDYCQFPSFFNAPLFHRILKLYQHHDTKYSNDTTILKLSKGIFEKFWVEEIEPYDRVERFFRLVKQPEAKNICKDDFLVFLQELLMYHPGLEFLSGTPEFQEKYALTVIVRFFYQVDRLHSGKISLRDLKRSDLVDYFDIVDEEEDINKVYRYFSYEHFYVLYCRFWELDTDHDFILSKDDLMRYGGHSLTRAIVDRIFDYGPRPFGRIQALASEEKNVMGYEDFIYFMLSEEDKSNPISLKYWFSLIDVNEDGVIRADEMKYFYSQQMHRMDCLGHEIVPFEDIVCQLCDILHPQEEGEFRFSDFVKPDKILVAGVFFNVLFNLGKFIAFEQRDPFLLRQQMAEPELTNWDRYARVEYARLAMEDDGRDEEAAMDIDSMDGWYVSEDEVDQDIAIVHSALSNDLIQTTSEAPF